MKFIYTIKDKRLHIANAQTLEPIWEGFPDDYSVLAIVPLDTDDCIVLLDFYNKIERFGNIIRCKYDGTIIWRSQLPNSKDFDAYTSINLSNDVVEAYSWSGFSVKLNIDNGRIVSCMFVK